METSDMQPLELPNDQDHTGRNFGIAERDALVAVLASGTLTSTKGSAVKRFEHAFAACMNARHAIACSSGTSAIHAALAALDLEPGDEVVTTPVTDMGALAPILYQTAIPVFADVDPLSLNVTPETIGRAISRRTRAIIVTHLFGNPVDIAPILALADRLGVPVIEDCAQAYHATYHGRYVGTLGAMACFSLQQGKHITCGEGGVVVTDDPALARRIELFVNKAWGYGDEHPDHYFLALNARMSELAGAVALAQLDKLADHVAVRRSRAAELSEALDGLAGIRPLASPAGANPSYWKYALHIDSSMYPDGPRVLAAALAREHVPSAPRYIQKPAFMCEVFARRRTFGRSEFPFSVARPQAVNYDPARYPGTMSGLASVLVLPLNERYTSAHVGRVSAAICSAVEGVQRGIA
ncbi:MAG: DegT/DnrJ/EryC1/StrS family aminotransferase [Candidatus Eremiobacteraeota bacterium]|nr:DegT/DnrJ/EryC1/StrS family aminotransferase [Candidatus Eremiobacteraeota bacterium]